MNGYHPENVEIVARNHGLEPRTTDRLIEQLSRAGAGAREEALDGLLAEGMAEPEAQRLVRQASAALTGKPWSTGAEDLALAD